MPSATIPVERYTVHVSRNTATAFTQMTIAGPVLAHGIQNRATLYFFPGYAQLSGWAQNVGGLNFDGVHVIAQVPFADFDRMYDLLRNEAPVSLYYSYGDSTTTTKPLHLVSLRTGSEPAGDGPEDEDAVASAIRFLVGKHAVDVLS